MPVRADALEVSEGERRQLEFLVAAHGLTAIARVNRVLDGSRGETSAEHSWHLALTAMVLAPSVAPEVDLLDVLGMLLVHDVVEVDAGDVPIYDAAGRAAVEASERLAAHRLFGILPSDGASRLAELWEAFEAAETPAARFARAVDRLQPILVHWAGDGSAWRERGITVAQEREIATLVGEFWPALATLADALVDDAARRGMLVA